MLAAMELVITLLVVGAILLLLETFLPGMIAGLVGGCCLVAGVVLGYVEFGGRVGTAIFLGTVVCVSAGFGLWLKLLPNTRVGRRFISNQVVGELGVENPSLLHQSGTAFTQLRPSGTALINGQRVDVVSEGALIEKGTPIKVVAIEGMRVVVRTVSSSPPTHHNPPHTTS
jgi:membrane-bound serine protease (ClpP class)